MSDIKPEPQSFADLPMQPTGSGVADEETAFLEAALEGGLEDGDAATPGESTLVPTLDDPTEAESASHPS